MNELRNMLKIGGRLGPTTQGKDFIRVRCYCDFEGHGRASETWEEHWEIELPQLQYWWEALDGYRRGKQGVTMKFHGQTLGDVLRKAKLFIQERGDRLEWIS